MKYFAVRVWEKAEHWHFDVTIEAADEKDAWKVARRDYPRRDYSIRELMEIFR